MIIKAPNRDPLTTEKNPVGLKPSVFLAGSIEMGNAPLWQPLVGELFSREGFVVFDPRRDDWDSTWEQSISNPQFVEQVHWELDKLEESDYIFMYLAPNTISPISLLEFGLHAHDSTPSNMYVVCPKSYPRRGNVEIVCAREGIHFLDMEDPVAAARIVIKLISNREIY